MINQFFYPSPDSVNLFGNPGVETVRAPPETVQKAGVASGAILNIFRGWIFGDNDSRADDPGRDPTPDETPSAELSSTIVPLIAVVAMAIVAVRVFK